MNILGPSENIAEIALQVLFAISTVLFSLVAVWRSKRVLNPVTIMSAFFFVPAFFSLFKLSSLQSRAWAYETYMLLVEAYLVWLLVPFVVVAAMGRNDVPDNTKLKDFSLLGTEQFVWLTRVFSVVVIAAYLVGNYLQTGLVIPLADPEMAYQAHAEFPFFLRFFARANPAAAGLLFLVFFSRRTKLDLLLCVLVALVPLTRLSRIDLALTLFVLAVLNGVFPLIRMTARNMIVGALLAATVVLGGTVLGHARTNRFGLYEVKYEDAIGWKPKVTGPFSVLPTAYGYFPLSFENLDRFVRENPDKRSYGLFTFDWLFTGFVKLNWFVGLDRVKARAGQFTPVSTGANVPTAVYPFYADFGAAWAWAPMLAYALFWLVLYALSRKSVVALMLYGLYTAGFGLASFQAIISAPVLVQQLAEVGLLVFLARRMSQRAIVRTRIATVAQRRASRESVSIGS